MSINEQHETRTLKLLLDSAMEGRTLHYEDIAQHLGTPLRGNALGAAISPLLGAIFNWCQSRGLPHLTSIVVRKSGTDKGLPGSGFWALLGKGALRRVDKVLWTEQYQRSVWAFWKVVNTADQPKQLTNTGAWDVGSLRLTEAVIEKLKHYYAVSPLRGPTGIEIQSGYVDTGMLVPQGVLKNTTARFYVNVNVSWDGPKMLFAINAALIDLEICWEFTSADEYRLTLYKTSVMSEEIITCIGYAIDKAAAQIS